MTVPSEVSSVSYSGNGTTTVFAIPFYFLENSHIKVILRSSTGSETTWVINVDYTLTGAGVQAGGTLTATVAPATGTTLVISRSVPATQETDYPANDPFPSSSHERALDKLTMIVQQNSSGIKGALRVPDTDPEPARLPTVTVRVDKLLSFDASGNPIAVAAVSQSATDLELRLANAADPAKGAGQIGRGDQIVNSITELRALLKTSVSKFAFVNGYYAAGDGGGGQYYFDAADTTSADNGGTIIVATDGGRWKLVFKDQVTVKQFGAKGNGVADDTVRLQAARDWLAAQTELPQLIFTTGIYLYSVSPNWAIQDAQIIASGEVKLRYTGTGNAVIFDADAADAVDPIPGVVYNIKFGGDNRFIIECPGTGLNAVFVRSIHHSKIRATVRGAGTSSAGLKVNFAVVTEFDIVVSVNEVGAWYLGAKPAKGYSLDERGVGETTSYCYFPNPIVEGVDIGIHLVKSLGNIFVGGTSEACSTYGVLADTTALNDRFIGTDFEANIVGDVFCQGAGVEFINCDSSKSITFGSLSKKCILTGGQHQTLLIDTGALGSRMLHATYNRFVSTGTFTDGGTSSTVTDVRNGSGAPAFTGSASYDSPSLPTGSVGTTTITVTGAKLGDGVIISSSVNLSGIVLNAAVTAVNTVTVYLTNIAGAPVDPPVTTLRAWIWRQEF